MYHPTDQHRNDQVVLDLSEHEVAYCDDDRERQVAPAKRCGVLEQRYADCDPSRRVRTYQRDKLQKARHNTQDERVLNLDDA